MITFADDSDILESTREYDEYDHDRDRIAGQLAVKWAKSEIDRDLIRKHTLGVKVSEREMHRIDYVCGVWNMSRSQLIRCLIDFLYRQVKNEHVYSPSTLYELNDGYKGTIDYGF